MTNSGQGNKMKIGRIEFDKLSAFTLLLWYTINKNYYTSPSGMWVLFHK